MSSQVLCFERQLAIAADQVRFAVSLVTTDSQLALKAKQAGKGFPPQAVTLSATIGYSSWY
jgi:hypothetical protein